MWCLLKIFILFACVFSHTVPFVVTIQKHCFFDLWSLAGPTTTTTIFFILIATVWHQEWSFVRLSNSCSSFAFYVSWKWIFLLFFVADFTVLKLLLTFYSESGNELPAELIHTLLRMAPTTEEELKLRLFSGELTQLGLAERFLKVLVEIPFAYKRLETLLFMCTLQEEAAMVKESFLTLEVGINFSWLLW